MRKQLHLGLLLIQPYDSKSYHGRGLSRPLAQQRLPQRRTKESLISAQALYHPTPSLYLSLSRWDSHVLLIPDLWFLWEGECCYISSGIITSSEFAQAPSPDFSAENVSRKGKAPHLTRLAPFSRSISPSLTSFDHFVSEVPLPTQPPYFLLYRLLNLSICS